MSAAPFSVQLPGDLHTCRAVANALATSATPFFPGFEGPEALRESAGDESPEVFRHTATRVDEERQLLVGALRLLGWSDRRIAGELKLSRNCIAPICQRLEKEGLLEPIRARVAAQVAEVQEQAILSAREMMGAISPEDPDKDRSAALKALSDAAYKFGQVHALVTGSPTEISARISAPAPARSAWDDWLRQHQVIEVTSTPDSHSGEQRSAATGCVDAEADDTTPVAADQVEQSGRPDDAAPAGAGRGTPGGGIASSAGPLDPDPKSASKFMGRSEPPAQAPTLP